MPSSLSLLPHTDIFIITETWLLASPPSRSSYPIHWTQHHLYGPSHMTNSGMHATRGVTILIRPDLPTTVNILPVQHQHDHSISFTLADYVVHCVYLPPSLPDQEAINTLHQLPMPNNMPKQIICGDFNARLRSFGDTRTTTRGTLFHDWILTNNIICLNQTMTYGIPTYETYTNNTHSSSIIDLFLTDDHDIPADLEIHSSLSLQSPHRAVTLTITMPLPPITMTPFPRRTWNLSRLNEPAVRALYQQSLADSLMPLHSRLQYLIRNPPTTMPNIDQLTHSFNTSIYFSLDRSLGSKPPRPKQKNAWFWTDHLQTLVEQRERRFRKFKANRGLSRPQLYEEYMQSKLSLTLAIKRRKRETWREFIQHLSTQEYAQTTNQIKNMRNKRKLTHTFSSPLGPQAAADTMANTLATTFNGSMLNPSRPLAPICPPLPISSTDFPSPFSHAVVADALRRLPNRKAPGPDHIRSEMLQIASTTLTPILSSLLSLCWTWSYTPLLWRQAQVIPIYKKGDPQDPSNYRPISLTSHMRKLMEHCLINLIPDNSPPLDISQGGFRPQRSALDQVTCLQHLVHHHSKTRSPPVLVFLDIKSAYDTVDRNIIWNYMSPVCSPPLLSLLQNMFDNVSISVLLSGLNSHSFIPTTGVLQGSVLSPSLYSLYINRLPATLRLADQALHNSLHHLPPPLTPQLTLNSLLYADDIVLIGTRDSIPFLLQVAERTSYDLGFRWHPAKCVVLAPPNTPPRIYHIYGTPLPHLPSFRYLGVPFANTGLINKSALVAHNRQAGLAALFSLVPLGLNPHGFPPSLLVSLYKQFIRPSMEYGLAITKLSLLQVRPLQQVQQQALRRMFGGHSSSETAVIQHLSALPPMSTRSQVLQAKYISRSQFLPTDSLLVTLLPRLNSPNTPWSSLKKNNPLWSQLTPSAPSKPIIKSFLFRQMLLSRKPNTLLSFCPMSIHMDPLLSLPMAPRTRSLLIRWRRGWLPGRPQACPCLEGSITRSHTLVCSLLPTVSTPTTLPASNLHPIDRLLNKLPRSNLSYRDRSHISSFWADKWPEILRFLATIEGLTHQTHLPFDYSLDSRFLDWLHQSPPKRPLLH